MGYDAPLPFVPGFWVPACAGMTGECAGMTGWADGADGWDGAVTSEKGLIEAADVGSVF